MGAQKVAIAVLVVVALVFAGGVAAGVFDSSPSADANKYATPLRRMFTERTLEAGDFGASRPAFIAGDALLVPPLQTRSATVVEADTKFRSVRLRLVVGNRARVVFTPSNSESVVVDLKLRNGKSVDLRIDDKGGRLSCSCEDAVAPPPGCRLRMEKVIR